MKKLLPILVIAAVLAACTRAPRTLTVMTHDSFAISPELLAEFEAEHSVQVEILLSGDTGTMLNKAILAKGAPLADVLYGVDNTYLSRALEAGIFEPYASPMLARVADRFKWDPANGALPIDYGDVCLNYDLSFFETFKLPLPTRLEDLLRPEFRGLLTVENPATSSPGMAFLLTTIGRFGPDNYLLFWEKLVENEVNVVNDWDTAYYIEFSQWGGPDPLVVSYASSPPFEVIFAEAPLDAPPTGAVTNDMTCFRQIEFAGILAGTEERDLAEAWIDFMLSVPFQEDIPLNMFVFPVNKDAQLQAEFIDYMKIPERPIILTPAEIAANRDAWIQAWTETVLR